MTKLDNKEIYLYGMIFSLVDDSLKLFEKCRHKRPSMWDKARGASREVKIEKNLVAIIKRKIDKTNDEEWGKYILDDMSFIAEDNDVWHGVNKEHTAYLIDIASRIN